MRRELTADGDGLDCGPADAEHFSDLPAKGLHIMQVTQPLPAAKPDTQTCHVRRPVCLTSVCTDFPCRRWTLLRVTAGARCC